MQKLSESELDIMMRIWESESPVYLDDLIKDLKEYNWAESTVRNFLARIIDKGYLKIEKDGRKNIYVPLVSEEYINGEGKELLERLYDNSINRFVKELYDSNCIDRDDLIELKNYIDEQINKGSNKSKKQEKTKIINIEKHKKQDKEIEVDKKEIELEISKEQIEKEIDKKEEEKTVLRRLKNIL